MLLKQNFIIKHNNIKENDLKAKIQGGKSMRVYFNTKKSSIVRIISFTIMIILLFTSLNIDAMAVSNNQYQELNNENIGEEVKENSEEGYKYEDKSEELTPEEYAVWKGNYLKDKNYDRISLMSVNEDNKTYTIGNYLRNKIIEAYVDKNGEFTIGTVNGSSMPTDNGKKLLYGHPSPWSSFTTVKIDGTAHKFDGFKNRIQTDDYIMISNEIDKIVTTQSLSIVENEYTGDKDTIAITYTITNYDEHDHEVGVRIMLDTMLGNNDGSPFRIPGYENVTNELELIGEDITQNWMAFDSLENPNVIANGCLYRTLDEKPDKVQFAAWGGVNGTLWDYTTNSNRRVTGDSAVAIYYNPKILKSGESRSVTTYYGIGDFTVSDAKPPLSTRISVPKELKADLKNGGYSHNPFSVTAYIHNNGNGTAINTKATLKLPEDGTLQLVYPTDTTQNVGDIEEGKESQATWLLYAKEQDVKKEVVYEIAVLADNESEKKVSVKTLLNKTVKVDENFTIALNKDELNLSVDGQYYEKLEAKCSDNIKRKITWLSTNPSVAKVDDSGVVKAISGGKANIIAAIGTKNTICEVSVEGTSTPLKKLELSNNIMELKVGQFKQLRERYIPTTVSQKGVVWTSSNENIVKVSDNGRLEGVAEGTAMVKATYNADNSKSAICTVTVKNDLLNISINESIKFKDTLYGPQMRLLGKDFNLFKIPMNTEIKINEIFSLNYDEEDKSYTATFGLSGDGTLTDKKEYRNDIRKIKMAASLLEKKGPKEFIKKYSKQLTKRKETPLFFQKGTLNTFGYIKYQQANGEYKFAEGKLYLVCNFPEILEFKYNIPSCPVVYFRFGISGDVNAGLKLEAEEMGFGNGQSMKLDGELGASLSLEGGVGADILIAGLEGGIKGTLSLNMEHLSNFVAQQDLTVELSASIYAKAKALFFLEFNESWKFASLPIYPRVSNDATVSNVRRSNNLNILTLDNNNFKPMSINIENLNPLELENDEEIYNFVNSGYAYNEPKMVKLDDGRIFAAWVDNVEGRDEFDRTAIYYSIYEDGIWQEKMILDDDGTADFAPSLATNGEKVYIAWQNMDKAIGAEADLNSMLPMTGIKFACYDSGVVSNVQVLTEENDYYDSAPEISCNDKDVSIIWCNNNLNDWTLYEGKNIVKQYDFSDGNNTSVSANNIYVAENIITSIDIEYKEDETFVAISEDSDNDFDTIENIKIIVNGIVNDEISSEIKGRKALLKKENREINMYWWDGNMIKSMKDMNHTSIKSCINTPISINYDVLDNGSIYWVETNGTNSELKLAMKGTNEWYLPVSIYDFDGVIRNPYMISSDNKMKVMTNLVTLDSYNNDNQVALVSFDIIPTTDIEIINTPYLNEMDLNPGEEIDVHLDIKNSGTIPADSIKVKLMDEDGVILTDTTFDEPIKPGIIKTITLKYTVPSPMKYHRIIAQISPIGMADGNLMNNESSLWLGDSDIAISDVRVSGYGETRKIYVEVTNYGYNKSEEIEVFITAKSTEGETIANTIVGEIDPRRKKNASMMIELSDIDFKNESGIVIYAQIKEGNESLRDKAMMSQIIPNPKDEGTITLASGIYDNKTVNLNLYSNVDRQVSGNMMIDLMNHDEVIFSCGQFINLNSYEKISAQYDISSLLVYPHDRIRIYMIDDNGLILSNKIYHNSQPISLGEYDIKLDKEQMIMREGDRQKINVGLTTGNWKLADITWSTSDKNIADVDMNGNVVAKSKGIVIISAESKILNMKSECKVVVLDKLPLDDYIDAYLKTNKISIDLAKDSGEVIYFTTLFKQNAADFMINDKSMNLEEYVSFVTEGIYFENEDLNEIFKMSLLDDGRAIVSVNKDLQNHKLYNKQNYNSDVYVKLRGSNEKINIGTLSIKTSFTLPKLSAKEIELESFFNKSSSEVIFKNKGRIVDDIITVSVNEIKDSKKNSTPEYFIYNNNENVLEISEEYANDIEKGKYTVKLSVLLKGYSVPTLVDLKVKVKESVEEIKLETDELYLRAIPNDKYAYYPLILPDNMKNLVIEDISLIGIETGIYDLRADSSNKGIWIKNNIIITGSEKYQISLKFREIAREFIIPVTIKAVTDDKDFRISRDSIKINRLALPDNREVLKVSGAADNDTININKYTEIIRGKEQELKNVSFLFDNEKGTLTIVPGSKAGNYRITIYPEGSFEPLELKIKVYNKYPKFKISTTNLKLNTQLKETEIIHISNEEGYSNEFQYVIKDRRNKNASIGSINTGDGYISITPYEGTKKGTYKLIITPVQGGGKSLKVKIKVYESAPKFTISSKKVNLNVNIPYDKEQAVLNLRTNPQGYETENFQFYQLDGKGNKTNLKDFNIIKGSDGKIYISRSSENVQPGTYNIVAESQNFKKAKILKFKVIVDKDTIVFTQKGKTVLNSNIVNKGEKSKIDLISKSHIDNQGEFMFFEKQGNKLVEPKDISIVKEEDGYYVALEDTTSKRNGTIKLIARSQTYDNVKDTNIDVKIIDNTPSMKVKFNNKLNIVDKSSYVEVALSMVKNNIQMSHEGKLSIDNINFSLYNFRPEENTVRIKLSEIAKLSDKESKTIVLTYEDNNGNTIVSNKVVIPVVTSRVKIKPENNLYVMYRNDKTDEALIKLTDKDSINLNIEDVILLENSHSKEFYLRTISEATKKFAIGIENEGNVKKGKYTLILKVKLKGIEDLFEVKVNIEVK